MAKTSKSGRSLTRRMFPGAALAPLAIAGAERASASSEAPKIAEIPVLKYDLESQTHWVGEAGSAKEATVAEFPVSQSIAGVSMRLKPGAIRELHWHALAAEWAYVIEGRCRATVIAPNGQSEIAEFIPGDTWYFPRGHGHALQGLGPGDCHFLLGFDNGHFSEFGTFSITDWIAHTDPPLPAACSTCPDRPRPVSQEGALHRPGRRSGRGNGGTAQCRTGAQPVRAQVPARTRHRPGCLRVARSGSSSSKEFPIQTTLTAVKMNLKPGGLRELHWHPHADEWQYLRSRPRQDDRLWVTRKDQDRRVRAGERGFRPQGYGHYIEQVGDESTEVLILFNSGEFQEISLGRMAGRESGLAAFGQLRHSQRRHRSPARKRSAAFCGVANNHNRPSI